MGCRRAAAPAGSRELDRFRGCRRMAPDRAHASRAWRPRGRREGVSQRPGRSLRSPAAPSSISAARCRASGREEEAQRFLGRHAELESRRDRFELLRHHADAEGAGAEDLVNLGRYLLLQRDLDGADAAFQRALERDPGARPGAGRSGPVAARAGPRAGGRRDAWAARSSTIPASADAHFFLGLARHLQRDYAGAQELARALPRAPALASGGVPLLRQRAGVERRARRRRARLPVEPRGRTGDPRGALQAGSRAAGARSARRSATGARAVHRARAARSPRCPAPGRGRAPGGRPRRRDRHLRTRARPHRSGAARARPPWMRCWPTCARCPEPKRRSRPSRRSGATARSPNHRMPDGPERKRHEQESLPPGRRSRRLSVGRHGHAGGVAAAGDRSSVEPGHQLPRGHRRQRRQPHGARHRQGGPAR